MNLMLRISVGALLAPAIAARVSAQMPVTTNAVAIPDADVADSLGTDANSPSPDGNRPFTVS